MLQMVTRKFSQNEWTDIVSNFHDINLIQTWEYGEAKAQTGPWKVERATFMDGDYIVGACQAMLRSIPYVGGGLVWINRGPLWQRQEELDISALVSMLKELRRYWVDDRRMYLRVAPPVRQEKADADFFGQHGYAFIKGREAWASARIDLCQPTEILWSRLRQNWRRHLKKAKELGLTCESGTCDRIFRCVLEEYERMLQERRLKGTAPSPLLIHLQAYLDEGRKLWALIGRYGEKILGGMLIARYGHTCEYLVGAFNEAGREVNVSHFLMWEAICKMKEFGYQWFDLGGMHPTRTPAGIFHFKSGFGGLPYQLFGELESYHDGLLNRLIRWRIRRERKL